MCAMNSGGIILRNRTNLEGYNLYPAYANIVSEKQYKTDFYATPLKVSLKVI